MTTTTRHIRRGALAFGLALLMLAPFALAQDDGNEASFNGDIRVGFTTVDVNGAERKFDEDYNIEQGPRLFDLHFDFVPDAEARKFVDRIDFSAENLGGDTFETLRVSARKFGAYNFSFDRRVSEYFYNDIIEPVGLSDPALAFAGDFHHFDFERVHDRANLDIDLTEAAKVYFGFDRYTRVGESTTTLDISRDEFELDKPIDESYNQYNLGFSYDWDRVTLVLEERFEEFDNDVRIFLPGQSLGEDPTDATIVDFFFLNQPYEFDTYTHTARLNARPTDRLTIGVAASLIDLDLDVTADEESQGTAFNGQPFTTDAEGNGSIEREFELFDIDLAYQVTDRVAVIGALRTYNLDQDGDFAFGGTLNRGLWEVETTSIDLGVEIGLSPGLVVSAGLREEERDTDWAIAEGGELEFEEETTDHTGWFANVGWSPNDRFRFDGSYEDSSYDDPFTLASATDRERIRLRARYKLTDAFSINGAYSLRSFENDNSGWEADYDQANLTFQYQTDEVHASFGYGTIDIDRSIFQIVTTLPGFGGGQELPFDIQYDAESDFLNGHLRWKVTDLWTVGGDARLYENDGSFGLEREDLRAYAEVGLGAYALRGGLRTVDYDEEVANFDDYDADILELSIGYRW